MLLSGYIMGLKFSYYVSLNADSLAGNIGLLYNVNPNYAPETNHLIVVLR